MEGGEVITYRISSQVGWHFWIFLFNSKDVFPFQCFSFFYVVLGMGLRALHGLSHWVTPPALWGIFLIHRLIFSFAPFWFPSIFIGNTAAVWSGPVGSTPMHGPSGGSTVRFSLLLKGVGLRHTDQNPGPLLEAALAMVVVFYHRHQKHRLFAFALT